MSLEVSAVVWKRDFAGSGRKFVAVKLADHADDQGRGIWPSVDSIAAQCDLSCRQVKRILADFVGERILKVVHEGGRGPGDSRRYDFDMAVVRSLPLAMAPPDSKSAMREKAQNKGDTMSPLDNSKGDIDDAKGDTDDRKGCHHVTQTVMEPPLEPPFERGREREGEDRADVGKVGDRAFKRAFAAWPTFVSDSEPAARKAWDGLATDDRLAAIERQADYVASVKATGRSKFCAYGVYLAERRWEKLPERAVLPVRATAPAFGPAWGAVRTMRLLAGPVTLGPPKLSREIRLRAYDGMIQHRGLEKAQEYYRRQGCDFDDDGSLILPADFDDRQIRLHRLQNGWPEVNAMHAAAEAGHGLSGADASRGAALVSLMEFVPADTPVFKAWQAEHDARGWPWFPSIGRMPGVWFPAGGPDQLTIFEKAVRGDEYGV